MTQTDQRPIKDQMQTMSPPNIRRATLFLCAATLLLALLIPSLAFAGTETVYTCRNADGSPGSDADWKSVTWQDATTPGTAATFHNCFDGGSVGSRLDGTAFAANEGATSQFQVAPPLRVTSLLKLERETTGLGRGGGAYADRIWYIGNKIDDGTYLDECMPAADASDPASCAPTFNISRSARVSFPGFGAPDSGWNATLICTGNGGNASCGPATTTAPSVHIYSAVFQVSDNTDPVVAQVSGPMAVDGTLSGSEELTVNATDSGSGVYQVVLKDGDRVVDTQVIDRNGGDCVDNAPGNADPYEFGRAVPCRTSVSRTLSFDTSKLSEGPITLRVALRDATGNETLAVNRTVTVDNIPAPRNTGAPTVGGTPQVGRSLVAGLGSWDVAGRDARYTYRWLRCDAAGEGCAAIAGDGSGHDLEAADAGRRLAVEVTAHTDQGSTTERSAPSAVVAAAPGGDAAAVPPAVGPGAPGSPATGQAASPGAALATLVPVVATLTRGAVNGAGASDAARLTAAFSGSRSSKLTRNWGRRTLVRGTLTTPAGTPIRGALVEVASVNANPGAREVDGGAVRTGTDGRWTATISGELASRALTFRYRSHLNDATAAAVASLGLRTRAGVTLSASPRTTGPHGLIRFKGRLRSGPIPSRGKLIELQARGKGGGRWLTFRTLRSSRAGTFRAAYRLRRTLGRVTYVFRARARAETAYPFLTGTSKVVAVKVR
jgi:hypothetical protein